MIHVFLLDDHTLFREGLRSLLDRQTDMRVVGEAETGAEGLRRLRQMEWDVLILDMSLPDTTGLEVLQQVASMSGSGKVLVVSMHRETQYALRCIKAGAHGYLTKDSAGAEVIEAIRRVRDGGHYVSSQLGQEMARLVSGEASGTGFQSLTNREYGVFVLIVEGMKRAKIAEKLAISPRTFDGYRRSILDKLGCQSDADLVRYAAKRELLSEE